MYAEHVPIIADAMRNDYRAFKNGIAFAVLSMRQPITYLPRQMADFRRKGTDSNFLFGHKRDAMRYVLAHGGRIWDACKAAPNAEHAISVLIEIPGLGIVKAAFVAQMMGFDVACLDSRNVAREGLNPRKYSTGMLKSNGNWRKLAHMINDYVIETGGRAHELWDTWCADAAEYYGRTAEAISEIHLLVVPHDYQPTTQIEEIPF